MKAHGIHGTWQLRSSSQGSGLLGLGHGSSISAHNHSGLVIFVRFSADAVVHMVTHTQSLIIYIYTYIYMDIYIYIFVRICTPTHRSHGGHMVVTWWSHGDGVSSAGVMFCAIMVSRSRGSVVSY